MREVNEYKKSVKLSKDVKSKQKNLILEGFSSSSAKMSRFSFVKTIKIVVPVLGIFFVTGSVLAGRFGNQLDWITGNRDEKSSGKSQNSKIINRDYEVNSSQNSHIGIALNSENNLSLDQAENLEDENFLDEQISEEKEEDDQPKDIQKTDTNDQNKSPSENSDSVIVDDIPATGSSPQVSDGSENSKIIEDNILSNNEDEKTPDSGEVVETESPVIDTDTEIIEPTESGENEFSGEEEILEVDLEIEIETLAYREDSRAKSHSVTIAREQEELDLVWSKYGVGVKPNLDFSSEALVILSYPQDMKVYANINLYVGSLSYREVKSVDILKSSENWECDLELDSVDTVEDSEETNAENGLAKGRSKNGIIVIFKVKNISENQELQIKEMDILVKCK